MAIKTIKYEVNIAGITPATEQFGGTQGDHRVTQLKFALSEELYGAITDAAADGKARYRFDVYDGEGGVWSSDAVELADDTVSIELEERHTRFGGKITVYLVITALSEDNEAEVELYSFPAVLRLKNRPEGVYQDGENYESVTALAEVAKSSALAAENTNKELQSFAAEIEEKLKNGEFDGVGVEAVEIINDELIVTYTDGVSENLGNVKGENGDTPDISGKVDKITRANATNTLSYGHEDNSVPYLYGVYGDKGNGYAETQGLIKGSTGKLLSVMVEEETDPDKKALLEKGILPDHSYADVHTVAIRDGNASIPVGVVGTQYGDLDEETGTFPVEDDSILWYGAAVTHTLLNDVHRRELQYAQYQRDVAITKALRQHNLKNGEGVDALQQNTCNAIGDYNIATGKETQAGVKGFKVTNIKFGENEVEIYFNHSCTDSANDSLVGYYAQLDLNKHWYNRYVVSESGVLEDGTGHVSLESLYSEKYPADQTNISLGDGDTDNWIWFTDTEGNIIDLDGATPIDQYIGGFATGYKSYAAGYGAFAAGRQCKAVGNYSTALGRQTMADYASMAIGLKTHALGQQSFASGSSAKALGSCAFAEGNITTASGDCSHAQGYNTVASGNHSYAGGTGTKAINTGAMAVGTNTEASGVYSYAGGSGSKATAYYSFAQGWSNIAKNTAATALGRGTIAGVVGQTVVGTFNKEDYNAIFIVGNGTSDTDRSNAFSVYKDGSIKIGNTAITEEQLQKILALIG